MAIRKLPFISFFLLTMVIIVLPLLVFFSHEQQNLQQYAATPSIKHIIIIPFENNQLSNWMADSYFASLANKYGSATNFHGFSDKSLPDYLMETSGSNQGTTDDNFTPCQYNVPNIYDVLTTNGLTYENYEESGNQDNHRHTPAYFYPSTCNSSLPDTSVFVSKYITGNAIPPSYVWVTPNFTNDAHDSDVSTASNWLKNTFMLDTLLSKPWFLDGSTLVILVCDDGGSSGPSTMDIMVSTSSMGTTSNTNYTHPNNLSTVMWLLGISGSIGNANASNAMNDLFSTAPAPSLTPPNVTVTQGITPSLTLSQNNVNFLLTICPHGLVKCGDNANPSSVGNTNPLHTQRTVTLTISGTNNTQVAQQQGQITYTSQSQNFQGTIPVSNLPNGSYLITVKMAGFLSKQLPGIITVTGGQTSVLPAISVTSGDINNDNQLDIQDYNLLISCYGSKQTTTSCVTPPTAQTPGADINDDGVVSGADYNLFLRELSVQHGG